MRSPRRRSDSAVATRCDANPAPCLVATLSVLVVVAVCAAFVLLGAARADTWNLVGFALVVGLLLALALLTMNPKGVEPR